jgi:hypothetical protein
MAGRFLTMAAAAALLLFAVSQAWGGSDRAKQRCGQPIPNPSEHWNAVFAHTSSIWQATVLRRKLLYLAGFSGVHFQKHYCDDVELVVPGVDTPALRNELTREAMAAHINISFEPPDILKRSRPGIFKAIFGTRPTLSRANKLQWGMAGVGFREGSDIERLALHSWRVVVLNIPQSAQESFAAGAASVGYKVTFVPQ